MPPNIGIHRVKFVDSAIYSAIYSANCHILVFFQCFQNPFKHEIDKNAGIGFGRAVIYGLIIVTLVIMNDGLHREMQKYRIQFAKDKRLPESPYSAISIGKGMDEFKLVMEYATANQKVIFGAAKPAE